jgi:hypothetical protein
MLERKIFINQKNAHWINLLEENRYWFREHRNDKITMKSAKLTPSGLNNKRHTHSHSRGEFQQGFLNEQMISSFWTFLSLSHSHELLTEGIRCFLKRERFWICLNANINTLKVIERWKMLLRAIRKKIGSKLLTHTSTFFRRQRKRKKKSTVRAKGEGNMSIDKIVSVNGVFRRHRARWGSRAGSFTFQSGF